MAATANSWRVYSGRWKTVWRERKASAALASGVLTQFDGNGYVIEATTTAGATDTPLAGIYEGPAVTAASANYATAELIPLQVPVDPEALAQGAIDTGTPAITDQGKSFDISATNGATVSTSTNEPVTLSKYISATVGLFVLTNLSSPAA